MKHKIKLNGQIVEVNEGEKVVASFGVAVKAVDKENYKLTMICSTEDIDRHGDTVLQSGWDLKHFKKNPVILNSHNYFDATEVIAKASKPRIEGTGKKAKLVMDWEFAVEENPKAKIIFDLYAGGFLHASSVGFIPKKFGEREDGGRDWFTVVEAELLEVSAVSVPANAAATLAKSIGANLKDVTEAIGIEDESVDEPEEVEEDTPEVAEDEAVEEESEEEEVEVDPEEQEVELPAEPAEKKVKPLSHNRKVLNAIHNLESQKAKGLKAARASIEKLVDVSGLKSLDEKTKSKVKNRKVHAALRKLTKGI